MAWVEGADRVPALGHRVLISLKCSFITSVLTTGMMTALKPRAGQIYPVQPRIRKSVGSMIRKLSVTSSQKVRQFSGTSWRRKVSIARLKSLKVQ